jgi:peptidoglycan-N-acetylglucosamine deacetylase
VRSGVALTFDDGPDPVWTPRLLDLLDRLAVTATFFPIATRAERAPTIIARMRHRGHTIGLHCDEHVRHSERPRDWVERDTDRALSRLGLLGVQPRLWRTPWGDTAPFTQSVADERALRLVGWSVDTHDWRGDSAEEMLAATRDALCRGAVVLAHDGIGPGALRADCRDTIAYVAAVVEHVRRRGWAFVALR